MSESLIQQRRQASKKYNEKMRQLRLKNENKQEPHEMLFIKNTLKVILEEITDLHAKMDGILEELEIEMVDEE
jgi:hypothetical protein